MNKLKNKIQEGLQGVVNEFEEDNFDIDATIQQVDSAIDPLSIDPSQKEILKAKALNKELEQDGVMGEGKPMNSPRLQQKPNPEFTPSKPRPSLQQKPNPEFTPSKPRPSLQQKPNPMLDEFDNDAVGRGIESGMNPEGGIDYSELDNLINQVNSEDGESSGLNLTKTDDHTDELRFENVRPSMTKSELLESVLGNSKPKVIKRVKVKDIKNGK